MDGLVAGEFGVEGGGELIAVPDGNDTTTVFAQDIHAGTAGFHARGTDEFQWNPPDTDELILRGETAQLPAVCVPQYGHRQRTDVLAVIVGDLLRKEDHAGTRTEDRHAVGYHPA